jgi:cell division septum initiation protein DivIVA
MALDKEFFDSIHIDVVKKKYYNANKVNALLEDIRAQAEALEAENRTLRVSLGEVKEQKDDIGNTLLTAQATAKDIISKANKQAQEIVSGAEAQAKKMVDDAEEQRNALLCSITDQQEYAVACVERTFERLKKQQLENVENINRMWQEFLCDLVTEETKEVKKTPDEATSLRLSELEDRVKRIADELMEINGEL